MERPQEPYFRLLRKSMSRYSLEAGVLTVRGALPSGCYTLPGNVSSQFITGLLYALPLLEGDSDILLTTPLESGGYVDMTLDVLERFGVRAVPNGSCAFHVPGGQTYRPHDMAIESDYSQAAFWYAARGLGSRVELQGLNPFSVQGDRCIVEDSASLCGPGGGAGRIPVPRPCPPLAVQAAPASGTDHPHRRRRPAAHEGERPALRGDPGPQRPGEPCGGAPGQPDHPGCGHSGRRRGGG